MSFSPLTPRAPGQSLAASDWFRGILPALVLLLMGMILAGSGLNYLGREWTRQFTLLPLARPGGWQKAMVAEGMAAVARRAERAARQVGDPAALVQGASILNRLVGAVGDVQVMEDLRRRSFSLARAALRTSPGLAAAHFHAAKSLAGLGRDTDGMLRHLVQAASLDPRDAAMRRQVGLLYLDLGMKEAAEAQFRAAIDVAPERAMRLFALLESMEEAPSPEEITPATPAGRTVLGLWQERHHLIHAAQEAYHEAIALVAGTHGRMKKRDRRFAFWAYQRLDGSLSRQGRHAEAEVLAASLLSEGPFQNDSEKALLTFREGIALRRQGRIEKSLALIRLAMELDSSNISYPESLGDTLMRLDRHDEAAIAYAGALSTSSRSSGSAKTALRLKYARCLEGLGRRRQALEEIRRVLMADPENENARSLIAGLLHD
ncbi:MAG: hypothetical protein ACE5ID_01095 [Acidobacteriota bacterium]